MNNIKTYDQFVNEKLRGSKGQDADLLDIGIELAEISNKFPVSADEPDESKFEQAVANMLSSFKPVSLTGDFEKDVKNVSKYIDKIEKVDMKGIKVLDANYIADANVVNIPFKNKKLAVEFILDYDTLVNNYNDFNDDEIVVTIIDPRTGQAPESKYEAVYLSKLKQTL